MSSTGRKRSRTDEASTGGNRKREAVAKAHDADVVLRKCRELKVALRAKNDLTSEALPKPVLPDSSDSANNQIVEVAELSATEVVEGIEGVALEIASQILAKKGFSLDVPSRAASNQIYVKEWDRIVLGGKRSVRSFMNVRVRTKAAFFAV